MMIVFLFLSSTKGLLKQHSGHQPRFFNLFNIVKFTNEICSTGRTSEAKGVCYTSSECSRKFGKEGGGCAAGFGRCCIISSWEDRSSSDEPVSYYQNEDYPSPSSPQSGTKVFTVSVTDPNVCQVRIDFDSFDLAPPTRTGSCSSQSLVIDGSVPMCGHNNGQNYYVHIAKSAKVLHTFNIVMDVATNNIGYEYKLSLRITQVDCNSRNENMEKMKAPKGCTQYFSEPSGTISSFNYDGVNMYAENQNYAICIDGSAASCGIRYKNPPQVAGKGRSVGLSSYRGAPCCNVPGECSGEGAAGTQESACGDECLHHTLESTKRWGPDKPAIKHKVGDWLAIAQGQLEDFTNNSDPQSYKAYYCGVGLGVDMSGRQPGTIIGHVEGNGVRDYSGGPFIVYFHTNDNNAETDDDNDEEEAPATNNLGFVIDYEVQTGIC